jgi:hypothetical protein
MGRPMAPALPRGRGERVTTFNTVLKARTETSPCENTCIFSVSRAAIGSAAQQDNDWLTNHSDKSESSRNQRIFSACVPRGRRTEVISRNRIPGAHDASVITGTPRYIYSVPEGRGFGRWTWYDFRALSLMIRGVLSPDSETRVDC